MRRIIDWFRHRKIRRRNADYAELVAWRIQNLPERKSL